MNHLLSIQSFCKKNHTITFILFFIFTVSILHHNSWKLRPTSVHAWAQSDHYNLAIGFLHNDFNFFHPVTYSLTHQFPPEEGVQIKRGVTAVDFPILHYVVAIAMFLLDDTSPWVFRLISLIWSFLALFYTFITIRKIKGIREAFFLIAFIMFQPFYCYYQNGFHVSSAAFNTLLIGYMFIIKHLYSGRIKWFYIGVLFVTVAALMRFTQIITLIATAATLVYFILRNRKWDNRFWIVLCGIIIVLCYFLYNQYMARMYGSIFLNEPIVPKSIMEFLVLFSRMLFQYSKGFVPPFHFLAIVGLVLFAFRNKVWKQHENRYFHVWLIILGIGSALFTVLMTWSLSVHDYYSLDVWMPVLTLFVIVLIFSDYRIPFFLLKRTKLVALFILLVFGFALVIQERKYSHKNTNSGVDLVINDFKESSSFLNTNIRSDSEILVICGAGWNTPMVGWPRFVSRVAWKFKDRIPEEMNKKYDVIVTHNAGFNNTVLKNYPEFYSQVKLVGDNGKVTIWEPVFKK